jgi:peptide/nickel transport system permease protein
VLALSEKEFVEAAVAQGAGPLRVMFAEILPNLASTVIVFFTLMIANSMLFEAGLSFLGAGVQPPNSSWGTMITVGVELLKVQPLLAILPGLMITLTVLALNIIGDGLRDALDPRAKVKLDAALQFEAQAAIPNPKTAP